jgi:RHS repeat-associated protein
VQNNPLGVGITSTSGTPTYYVREPDGSPVSTKTGSTRAYYVTDQLGSVTGLTNGSGLANSYRYQPYGALASSSTTVTNQLKFAGVLDTGLGVYHYCARYYDPAASRWTQIDPIDQAGDLREANRYAYAGDDPIGLADPGGLCLVKVACGAQKSVAHGVSSAGKFVKRNALHLYATGEVAAYTVAAGAIAVGGTAACVAGTAGTASVACGAIAVTAGTVAAGGAYATYREAREIH